MFCFRTLRLEGETLFVIPKRPSRLRRQIYRNVIIADAIGKHRSDIKKTFKRKLALKNFLIVYRLLIHWRKIWKISLTTIAQKLIQSCMIIRIYKSYVKNPGCSRISFFIL